MRQMIQSRYSFGYVCLFSIFVTVRLSSSYFGIIIPAILNLIGLCGFNILNGILGGQALASVSSNMSWECVWHLSKSFILPNPYQCRHCHYLRHCASRAFSFVILEILCLHNDHTFRSPSWATEYSTGKW